MATSTSGAIKPSAIFFNPSLRARLSSVKAAYNLGVQAWVLNAGADSC